MSSYQVPHYIAGRPVIENTGLSHPVHNPATNEQLGVVYFAGEQQCEAAIAAAKTAAAAWAATSLVKRSKVLFKFRDLLEKHQKELAEIVTREHGKTLEDAMGSVSRAIEVVEMNCGLLTRLQGHYSTEIAGDIDCHTLMQPLGVCAGVSPFNFPVMVPVWMMIPAIACGNAFILKPSEQAPSAPVRIMELLSEAGLPDGVVTCLHGDKNTVDYLIHHPDIASMTAVASTPVARSIYTEATAQGKRAHTFGGAKNHAVVMPDADFEYAAKAIVGAAYGSAGERCMAISVLVAVGEQTAETIIDKMSELIRAIEPGPGHLPQTEMGPLISKTHREKVLRHVDEGVKEGADLIIDGRTYRHADYPEGYYVGPCLFDKVTESMQIYQQEIFGPVLIIVRANDFEDALALVNRNQYGNGTAIFTRDGYTAREYSYRVQVGMVGVNIPIPVPIASHPFGGWKHSSFGDTNMHGLESVHFYTRRKTITSKWPVTHLEGSAFSMPTHD